MRLDTRVLRAKQSMIVQPLSIYKEPKLSQSPSIRKPAQLYHQSFTIELVSTVKMAPLVLLTTLLASLAAASPAKISKRGLSLPPLIPAIPGVTEPLNDLAPPLPILQVPTPPLDSPPFAVENI